MSAEKLRGNRIISGSWGSLWLDGDRVIDIVKFEAKLSTEREDITLPGSMDIDSKLVALKGEGTMTTKKVYSREWDKFAKKWLEGLDPRSKIIAKLSDPDSFGTERVIINNVWFIGVDIMNFESKKPIEQELKFGFTASDLQFVESILNKV